MLSRLEAKIAHEPNTGCWLWAGALNRDGYGSVHMDGHNLGAHRVVYESEVGPIPDGLEIDHLCRTRCCVNPAHLEPVTAKENARRRPPMEHKFQKLSEVCRNGHPRTADNTDIVEGRYNSCKVCRANYKAKLKRQM